MTKWIIGGHVDTADAVAQAAARGADIAQISLGDPKSWKKPVCDFPGGSLALREAAGEAGLTLVVHSAFVINVASLNNRIRIPSRKLLQQTLDAAAEVGAMGVVVHGGHVRAGEPIEKGQDNWRKAIDGLEMSVPLFVENTAGGDNAMARFLERLSGTWEAIGAASGHENVGFCLDTCHAFAAGLDMASLVDDVRGITGRINLVHANDSQGAVGSGRDRQNVGFCLDTCHAFAAGLDMASLVDDVRGITGRINLVHANDSQGAVGSGRDRHANLGEGQCEADTLVGVIRAAEAPVVVETPGEAEGQARDIAWLRERL